MDGYGRTLYAFTKDANGTPTCVDACAKAWPPAIVTGDVAVQGLRPGAVHHGRPRPDGSMQLKMGKWPLYSFSGDAAPGDVNGQGSGGSWFVVGQDGKLIK